MIECNETMKVEQRQAEHSQTMFLMKMSRKEYDECNLKIETKFRAIKDRNECVKSKVEESDIIVDKLFTENPSLNKNLMIL